MSNDEWKRMRFLTTIVQIQNDDLIHQICEWISFIGMNLYKNTYNSKCDQPQTKRYVYNIIVNVISNGILKDFPICPHYSAITLNGKISD